MGTQGSSKKLKQVAIVGAGPAGLVAAKTLLATHRFDVLLFEKNARIGGIWALDEHTQDGYLAPETPTNLSKFTVGFSDLDWREVDLRSADQNSQSANRNGHPVPMFPRAWMAAGYLEEYQRRYVPVQHILLNHEVTFVSRIRDANGDQQWQIEVSAQQSSIYIADYVIVASGFFSRPRDLAWDVPFVAPPATENGCAPKEQISVPKMHSSQFRTLEDLVGRSHDIKGKRILIIGGGNSSGETAGNVAFQLSSALWSVDSARASRFEDVRITHVTPRPLYALPPFVPVGPESTAYLPLDLKLYDLSKRPAGPIEGNAGPLTSDAKNIIHNAIRGMVGNDQSDLSGALVSHEGKGRGAPYVVLSESYSEYVRQGLIEVVGGRVTDLRLSTDDSIEASIASCDGTVSDIRDVAAVIYATGYTPAAALQYLSQEIKEELRYDSTSMRLPLILEQWQTMDPRVPNLAMLGFYEGPYWGIMEMQARLTAQRWVAELGADGLSSQIHSVDRRTYEDVDKLLRMRRGMKSKDSDIPQYWFGDYLGYMEEIADVMHLERNDGEFDARQGCVSPARYMAADTNKLQASNIMADLHRVWQDCHLHGRYVPRAAFRALHGTWSIHRKLDSSNAAMPSGSLDGTASFHPRIPISQASGEHYDLEYLYSESGTFSTSTGISMTATRRYVYRYSEERDCISVWFVKPEAPLEVDYLFHDLKFVPPKEARRAGACVANADHLCVRDMYWTEYRLPLQGIGLPDGFELTHKVKGPQKDYIAVTTYRRP